jgi:hypothetical protein
MSRFRVAVFLSMIGPASVLGAPADPPDVVETAKDYTPLTSGERWQRYGKQSVLGPTTYLGALASGLIQQWDNSPPEWHQGMEGYGKRVASSFATFNVDVAIYEGSAAALGYEPRYIHSGQSGFMPRLGHAVKFTFLTYDSKRHLRFNVPAFAAAYGGAMITTTWYPDRYSALHDGVRIGNYQLAVTFGLNVLREFSPEFRRALHLKH